MKDHKGTIIVWIVIKNLEYFSLIVKFTCSKWHKSKMFLHVQSTQTLKVDNLYFFKCFFFLHVPHSFWKMERFLTLMIKRAKGLELMKMIFNNWFEHIWFKHVFDPKRYRFWKYGLNKNCSYLCDRGHVCIIYMI